MMAFVALLLVALCAPTVEAQTVCCEQRDPAPGLSADRPTRPLPEIFIDRIKQLEGWRSCEKNGINGYNTKAEVPGECIPKVVGNDRLYDELLEAVKTVDAVNANLPVGTRAALASLTHDVGNGWTKSYLGTYVREGRWDLAKELIVAYVGDGSAADQAAKLKRRRIELSWVGRESAAEAAPRRAPAPKQLQPVQPTQAPYVWRNN